VCKEEESTFNFNTSIQLLFPVRLACKELQLRLQFTTWPTPQSGQSLKFQILGMMILYRSEISCWWWKNSRILNLSPCIQKMCSLLPWYTEFPVYFWRFGLELFWFLNIFRLSSRIFYIFQIFLNIELTFNTTSSEIWALAYVQTNPKYT
jgi:hypothetical protein